MTPIKQYKFDIIMFPEYLEAIYDEISVNEIKMRYDKADLKLVQNTSK